LTNFQVSNLATLGRNGKTTFQKDIIKISSFYFFLKNENDKNTHVTYNRT